MSFKEGQEVLTFDGKRLLHATILQIEDDAVEDPYLIHFKGKPAKFNRWVGLSHLVKSDADGLEYQKELEDKHHGLETKEAEGGKKKKRKEVPPMVFALLESLEEGTVAQPHTTRHQESEFKQELKELFHQFDTDKSGTIDKTELAAILKAMGKRPQKAKVDALFETLDVDGNGSLEFDEFFKFFTEKDLLLDSRLYCTCNQLSKGFMVCCDGGLAGCKGWYHGKCIGIHDAKSVPDVWFCPTCLEQSKAKKAPAYRTIHGVKYDKAMLEIADAAMAKGGKVDLEAARDLVKNVVSDDVYSKIERRTMSFIRRSPHYNLTTPADNWIRSEIASFAARKAVVSPKKRKASTKDAKPDEEKTEADEAKMVDELARETLEEATGNDQMPKRKNTEEFRAKLRKVFNMLDMDKSGHIDQFEARAVMRNLGIRPTKTSVETMFTAMDTNGDGTIDFEEFSHYFLEDSTEEDLTPYCSCRQKAGGRFMICCDGELEGCYSWYHGSCVGVKEGEYPELWFCPHCALHLDAKKADSKKKLEHYRVIHKRKYDHAMLEKAEKAMLEKGVIDLATAHEMVMGVMEDGQYTTIEKNTMHYIRSSPKFKIAEEAEWWFRKVMASWAARMGHAHRKAKKEKAASNKKQKTEAAPEGASEAAAPEEEEEEAEA